MSNASYEALGNTRGFPMKDEREIGVLGLLCFDPFVSLASLILYEEDGLQGYAQGV
jgi:hypothetical protein